MKQGKIIISSSETIFFHILLKVLKVVCVYFLHMFSHYFFPNTVNSLYILYITVIT